ncbi:MAG: YicC family protein [Oscillospiraceae bacterium]|jgi:uncharacterized protein (TIGR00255 family)|nr:YicC family protein [Oscillospiraceae bacterium]
MTGFGSASKTVGGRSVTVEARSVNHRFLDVAVKSPRSLNFLEDNIRKLAAKHLARGHVDISIQYQNKGEDSANVALDEPLLKAYRSSYITACRIIGEPTRAPSLQELVAVGVLKTEPVPDDQEAVLSICEECAALALANLTIQRELEGAKLRDDLLSHINTLSSLRDEIAKLATLFADEAKARLEAKLRELLDTFDEQRVIQEVAILMDRAAIDEELSRLASHLKQLFELSDSDESIGRKLDFIIQECLREANTIGSKAQSIDITKLVVEAKGEIEKLREQAQNVE